MSAGYGPPSVNTFGMIAGLGKTFGDAYDAGVKERQEREAPDIIAKLVGLQSAGADPMTGGTLGSLAQSYQNGSGTGTGAPQAAQLPSFAGGGAAPMRMPGSGGENETKFVDALKAGGLTNPYGLAAMAAYAGRESGYKGSNITGSWSDPSQSGQPGTSGGILSWRGDRFTNMQRMTAGASDPVAAQAKYALVENPDLTLALQQAKSPEEANALMARAWKFAGWDQAGGENAARLASTRAYVASLGGGPPQQASAPAPNPQAAATAASSDKEDAADKPAANAKAAGFVIPGQGAATPAQAAPQGFAGFGSPASRISPEQQEILTAAWKNPVTRPMATQIYGELLKGKQSQWQLTTMGDQPVLFNQTTAQIMPVGQAKRQTATVDGAVVDVSNGQEIYRAPEKPQAVAAGASLYDRSGHLIATAPDKEKEDKYTYQSMPGVGMVALHPTDPDKSRVIIAGQQPRAMTPEESAQFSKGYYGSNGDPHVPSAAVQVLPAEKEKDKKIGEALGGEIADAINAGRPALEKLNAIGIMRDAFDNGADKITTGPLADRVLALKQFAKGSLGMNVDGLSNSEVIQKIGTQLATANAKSLTSRPTQFDFATYLKNNPGLLLSPEGNKAMLDILQQQAQREYDLSRLATRPENQGDFGSVVDAYDKAHPIVSPFTKQPIQTGDVNAPAASTALPKGKDRVAIPGGISAGAAIAQAKQAVAAGKDKGAIADRLRSWGIDPKRLDD